MPFDFKKAEKQLYQPKETPGVVEVPPAHYIAIEGMGDPNEENGAYQKAVNVLYAVAYTLKMSYKTDYKIEGFYEYVVPPLEGFWWQEGTEGADYSRKTDFHWISVLRLPDFVTEKDFAWAVETAGKEEKIDCSSAKFWTPEEGLCIQALHIGPYDTEPETVARMDAFLADNGFRNDFSRERMHHEIDSLSDPRKTPPEKWKTVIRHPIGKV